MAQKFNETLAEGGSFGVIGSNHTTNEENYYLQKFARQVLGTNNIDHHRTGDVAALLDALGGKAGKLATVADLYERKAVLVLGADLALEHPLLSFQIRANYRHHQAHVYAVTPGPVREDKYAAASVRAAAGRRTDFAALESPARQAEGRAGAGDRVRRFLQGRRRRAAGGFRRIAGHPGEVRLPGGLFQFARRASIWASRPNCCRDTSHPASRDAAARDAGGGSGRAVGGGGKPV